MNIPLFFWASEETGDKKYMDAAVPARRPQGWLRHRVAQRRLADALRRRVRPVDGRGGNSAVNSASRRVFQSMSTKCLPKIPRDPCGARVPGNCFFCVSTKCLPTQHFPFKRACFRRKQAHFAIIFALQGLLYWAEMAQKALQTSKNRAKRAKRGGKSYKFWKSILARQAIKWVKDPKKFLRRKST